MRAEAVLALQSLHADEAIFHDDEWVLAIPRDDWEELDGPETVTVAVWNGDQGVRGEL